LGLIDRCTKISSRQATKEELLSKHTAEHIDLLKSTEHYSDKQLEQLSSRYDSIYLHNVCCLKIKLINIINYETNNIGTWNNVEKLIIGIYSILTLNNDIVIVFNT